MPRCPVGPGTRVRLRELVVSTELDPDVIAWMLDIRRRTLDRVVAEEGIVRPDPDLAELVRRVQGAQVSPQTRWEALAACLWGLVSLETRARTGEDPGRAPALSPDELKGLLRGATAIETALAQARAALLQRHHGEGGGDAGAGDLAQIRAELARRVAAAHRAADDAGLALRHAGADPPGPAP